MKLKKLKWESPDEFRSLLTALLDDLTDARFNFRLHQSLVAATKEYAEEFGQSLTFWNLTFGALIDAVVIRLCRAYDTQSGAVLNLGNLLEAIRLNMSIFDEPNFRERLKGNVFVDSLAANLKPPDPEQLQKDIEAVSVSDPLVNKLIKWRHNYIAHRSSTSVLVPQKLAGQHPFLYTEIDALLSRALQIGNRYSMLFDASVQSTMMIGKDDYLTVLEAIRDQHKARKRELEEKWRLIEAANPSD
jgi:hypothetical protein